MMDLADSKPFLFVVNHDNHAYESMETLAASFQMACRNFSSAESLLAQYDSSWRGVLLIDHYPQNIDGLELQRRLIERNCHMPVIIISSQIDVRSAVQAMKQGAVTVLETPYTSGEIVDAIRRAVKIETLRLNTLFFRERLEQLLAALTPRELQVMELLAECTPRKTIAHRLSVSHRTAERLCARVYEKTETESPVELAKLLAAKRGLNDVVPLQAVPGDDAQGAA